MTKSEFLDYLHAADFGELFRECAWAAPSSKFAFQIEVGDYAFEVREVAQKNGFRIYTSAVDAFPPASIRRTLDAKLRKHSHAYFIIFTLKGEEFHHQWLVPVDAVDKRRIVPVEYADDTHADFLFEKVQGITFGFDEITSVLDVIERINSQFLVNSETVTNSFYQGFRKQHAAFVKGIEGIPNLDDRAWYASVMLNRLMFCYFIQKKGFFMDKFGNPDLNYLQNHLQASIRDKGANKFFVFYRGFLMGLFQQGLNNPNRSESFINKYGMIPYLNGGMFEEHELEANNVKINIPDKVFISLFKFFDEWRWHLDDRITKDGRDINPDVLGYIFEQYINEQDRGDKGAFYTKEDVTGYIGRNSILPHIFQKVMSFDSKPFKPDGDIWKRFQCSGDKYIFNAVKKGVNLTLPKIIEDGLDVSKPNVRQRRAEWSKLADEEYALPAEIWSEVVERRQRYAEVVRRIESGTICQITDFITYNLDIRTFVEDVIRNTNDHLLVKHFYDAVREVSILDPTCGSGAFLFASLNILEPVYEACLDRMEEFNAKDTRLFKDELREIRDKYRSNRQYFIYKNIILRNLYGVDIMHEATEIARLRLFLKMVAVVEADPHQENLGLDPLPDVDFNIRCGNTLVGYASPDHLQKALTPPGSLALFNDEYNRIEVKTSDIAVLCNRFRMQQLSGNSSFYYRKQDLNAALKELRNLLDETLARAEFNINPEKKSGRDQFKKWRDSVRPFHWYSEFYHIIVERGGFDVVIGNPPYVSRTKIDYLHAENDFKCADLYGYVIRRVYQIQNRNGHHGFIVMHNLAFSDDFKDVRKIIFENSTVRHFSFYSRIPSGLFSGNCRVRNTIYLTSRDGKKSQSYTTRLHRWYQEQRDFLLANVKYGSFDVADVIPMSEYPTLLQAMQNTKGPSIQMMFSKMNRYPIYYKKIAYNFLSVSIEEPPCYYPNKKPAPQTGADCVNIDTIDHRDLVALLFCGRFYFAKWCVFGDDFHYTLGELMNFNFPFSGISCSDLEKLKLISCKFKRAVPKTIQFKLNAGKYVGTYNTSSIWSITDESDLIFLKYIVDNPVRVQEELVLYTEKMAVSFRKEGTEE